LTLQQLEYFLAAFRHGSFTGAAEELREALPCNPFDLEGLAAAVELALELDVGERRRRLVAMAQHVHDHDVFAWVERELGGLERSRR
jgi:trehalose-6-phosphate synthase